jgi:hypothetical protein
VTDLNEIYSTLIERSRADGFAGWDPFDGLESRIFRSTPLRHIAPARMAWLQMIKRSPWNLRSLLRVPKGLNSKGLALFALAEMSRYRTTNDPANRDRATEILDRLRTLTIETKNGVAFGYNFDWQSRAFFAPKGTPTIVPTAFAARAFLESFQSTGDERDLEIPRRICRFIATELQRPHETDQELCFSYTPGDTSRIYNASLLAAETLADVGAIDANDEYLELASKAARYAINAQGERGEWAYGPKLRHAWIDNFHTAFILSSLVRIVDKVPALGDDANVAISKGFEFWIANFFTDYGAPKYFDTQTYPIDIHSAAAAIVTLCDLRDRDQRALPLAEKVGVWTAKEMWNPEGFFAYQKKASRTISIPFIRWGQAWMAYAIARLLEARG